MLKDNLIQLLRHVIRNNSPYELPTGEDLAALYAFAQKQDLVHLLGIPFRENGQQVTNAVLKEELMAIWRYEQQNFILTQIREALEEAGIYFIPLKGVVLRKWYPEPWMRTCADVDILVREEDTGTVSNLFLDRLGYQREDIYSKDISFYANGAVHIELHHTLIEKEDSPYIAAILEKIWETSVPVEEKLYELCMTDEMFYFYHISHMRKHFKYAGGCGVRAFLDLWLLDHVVPGNQVKRDSLIESGGMTAFANAARSLSEMWFSGVECSEMQDVAQFILDGGIYGTRQRKIILDQQAHSSPLQYYKYRAFPTLEKMKINYPILNKYRWLILICWMHRWLKLLNPKIRKRTLQEFGNNSSLNSKELITIETVYQKMGIPLNEVQI